MANETKIERILQSIAESAEDSARIQVGKLLIVAAHTVEGDNDIIDLYAWTETDLVRWHDAVVRKRYDMERANGKEPTWSEAFAAVEWPESRETE